jgi:hypothetical protein
MLRSRDPPSILLSEEKVDPQALGRLLEVLHQCSVWDFSSMIGMRWVALRVSGASEPRKA